MKTTDIKNMSHKMPEPRIFKHQKLMGDLNETMVRIKMFYIDSNTIRPTIKELDDITHRIMEVLRKDSEPCIKHFKAEEEMKEICQFCGEVPNDKVILCNKCKQLMEL